METKRTWHKTKADWAAAQARDYREAAMRSAFRTSYGYRPRAQMISSTAEYNRKRAEHFEALAERFKAEGV